VWSGPCGQLFKLLGGEFRILTCHCVQMIGGHGIGYDVVDRDHDFLDRLVALSLRALVRLGDVKVVRRKLAAYICRKNFFPRFLPNLLRKRIIISLPNFFDLPGQRATKPAVSGIG
jgi:hypothetical protein